MEQYVMNRIIIISLNILFKKQNALKNQTNFLE